MNAVVPMTQRAVEVYGDRSLTAADIQSQVNLIQDVMRSVMFEGTHYGKIPGTNSVSLYKPGAEKLMATFRLACDPEVEDLCRDGEIHYRVKVKVYSSGGTLLGAGIGECSSQEEKYAWRAPVCDEEFELTPENRRRFKFKKAYGGNKPEKQKQVRTNPADVGNTVLKMAKKRGLVDAILTVTAASDIFTQDIEDLPEEVAAQIARPNRYASAPIPDSPERDAAIKEATDVASLGSEKFRAFWKAWPQEKRALVTDRMDAFKAVCVAADAKASEAGAEPTGEEIDNAA
jgi:hypothetical protein